jgi:hypothetical protein
MRHNPQLRRKLTAAIASISSSGSGRIEEFIGIPFGVRQKTAIENSS